MAGHSRALLTIPSLWFGGLFAVAMLCASCRAGAGGKGRVFRAGAYAIDVTPKKLPVIVNGGMVERTASKVTDPLHARCLVLDDGTTRIAFALVDNCVIPRSLMEKAKALAEKATGIPTKCMLIAATHAHSCPAVAGVLGSDVQEDYAAYLPGRIAKGIEHAHKRLAPARVGWAVGSDPNNVFCRRFLMKPGTARTCAFTGKTNDQAQMNPGHQNPNLVKATGPRDTDVSVLSLQGPGGKPIALLGNYSTHYVGAPPISADYFAVFADEIGKLIGAGEGFVGILSNGTSGDQNSLDFVNPRRKFDRFSVGRDVATAAFQAYKTIEYYDWAPIVMTEKFLTLKIRMPDESEVVKAKEYLAPFKGRKPRTVQEVYARETVVLSESPPTRELKLQAIRIGSLGIAAMPNEVFASTGLAIKKSSPLKPTFSIELANGYDGYIPPPEQHELGGYTTWRARSSCLEEQAEPKIKAAVLELLSQVAETRQSAKPVPAK